MNFTFLRDTIIGRYPAVAVFILIHAVIFSFIFTHGIYANYEITAFGVFYEYGTNIADGLIPYRDFAVEYPPLALLLLILPGLAGPSVSAFSSMFIAEIVFIDLGMLVLMAVFARRFGLELWRTLGVYTLLLLAVGPIIMLRYDLVPAFMVLLSVYLLVTGRVKASWLTLGLAVMTKLYAVVLAPLFLLWHWRRGEKRELVHGGLVFAVTLAAVSVVPLIISAGGYVDSFLYHSDRPLQVESLYSSVMLAGERLGWWVTELSYGYGSVNIVEPGSGFFGGYYWLFVGFGLPLVYWLFDRFLKKSAFLKNRHGERDNVSALGLIAFSAAAICVFIIFNKVLSPQFIIWLLPLVPLLWRGNPWPWVMLFVIGWATAYVYPLNYIDLQRGEGAVTWVLLGRNLLLVGLAVVLVWRYIGAYGRKT